MGLSLEPPGGAANTKKYRRGRPVTRCVYLPLCMRLLCMLALSALALPMLALRAPAECALAACARAVRFRAGRGVFVQRLPTSCDARRHHIPRRPRRLDMPFTLSPFSVT